MVSLISAMLFIAAVIAVAALIREDEKTLLALKPIPVRIEDEHALRR